MTHLYLSVNHDHAALISLMIITSTQHVTSHRPISHNRGVLLRFDDTSVKKQAKDNVYCLRKIMFVGLTSLRTEITRAS